MLNVFITVDTEIWPFSVRCPTVPLAAHHTDFNAEIGFYIRGDTDQGAFGLPYQLACLHEHGLKATYFVESLSAGVIGLHTLREIVSMIQSAGQEVQLHAHPEWLSEIRDPALPTQFTPTLGEFALPEQAAIIGRAAANLREAGARKLCAFRAGSFGANFDTLRALAGHGIKLDSSHNTCYLNTICELDTGHLLTQPQLIEGVYEFPMSFFSDFPWHYRHTQLCACSFGEMAEALLGAWRAGWYAFVILLHGSELLGKRTSFHRPAAPSAITVRRFRKLCRFLAHNTDKFRTTVFSEIDPASIPAPRVLPPPKSRIYQTAWRVAEQLAETLR